jgi:uncharacterized membrane protein YeiB
MTLTLYTAHVLVLLVVPESWDEPTSYLVQVVVALVVAPLWLWRFRRGPVEQVVHTLSHDISRALVRPRP